MFRLIFLVLLSLVLSQGARAQNARPLTEALAAIRAKDWTAAEQAVRRQGDVAKDIVEWHRLRAGIGSSREAAAFVQRRPDWPGLSLLRKKNEAAFGGAPAERTLSFFANDGAQTAEGALVLADALRQSGQKGAAEAEIVLAWRTLPMSDAVHAQFLEQYSRLLKDHHVARLDYMLWQGWKDNSQRMYPLVSEGWRRLSAARLSLRADRTGVDVLIEAVPSSLKSDPGLAFERFQWRARKGRNDSAIELLLAQSRAAQLGEPEKWAGWRRGLARSDMRAGQHRRAYAVASTHGLFEGSAYADLEWLSGYLALRFLNDPEAALQHFVRFEQAIQSPISMGRAGYWIGRAFEALGESESAQRAYAGGAQYQTSFYGLLAAEKAGAPVAAELAGTERIPEWRGAAFTNTSVHKAAIMLLNAGELSLAERFWTHLAESQDRLGMAQMGQMAIDLGEPHIAVMLGKRFAQQGITIHAPYYPLHDLARRRDLPVSHEMALSIARRESEFDPTVVSHANAYGLMQILPGTARQVAGALGVPYSKSRLISDPSYNVTLGTAYLSGLADEFDGNVIMVAAGYNAGPGRPTKWMEQFGDPRRRNALDIVDWIEHIPFTETRNYVMRVAESMPIYRARLGKPALPQPFSAELVGRSVNGS